MDTKEVRKLKTSLDILQVAASDKENLSQKIATKKKLSGNNGRTKLGKKDSNISISSSNNNKNSVELKNKINKLKTDGRLRSKIPDVVIAADLTSDAPSEKYWENLAETRRVALESALKENLDLNNKLNEMEYENVRLKEMLKEAQTLVEVLTEMLESNRDEEGEPDSKAESEAGSEIESEANPENFSEALLGPLITEACTEADCEERIQVESSSGDMSENESFQSCI